MRIEYISVFLTEILAPLKLKFVNQKTKFYLELQTIY